MAVTEEKEVLDGWSITASFRALALHTDGKGVSTHPEVCVYMYLYTCINACVWVSVSELLPYWISIAQLYLTCFLSHMHCSLQKCWGANLQPISCSTVTVWAWKPRWMQGSPAPALCQLNYFIFNALTYHSHLTGPRASTSHHRPADGLQVCTIFHNLL